MTRAVVDILLAMDGYAGPIQGFNAESVMRLCTSLGIIEAEAQQKLKDLIQTRTIRPGLIALDKEPEGRWKWELA